MMKGITMKCESIKTNIPSLLAEDISPDERIEMLRHMEGCRQCRNEMEEMGKTWKLMDRWKIEEPSARIKSRLMAAAREELQQVDVPWWSSLRRSFVFRSVLGALGFSLIIYFIFPYGKTVQLCETNILNGGLLALFPKGLIYFALGLLYGLVPMSISGICFSERIEESPMIQGLGAGLIFAAFLVPFFIARCPEFSLGLILIMALGILAGSLSGGTGTLLVLNRVRMMEA
jgi:Putative zinc-finger